ncbi:hypothetical protein ABZ318_37220 [Streptomyces sp. NPDC006197]|uniref:hypothetical protein n=1 Tax=Streptomyces sp. NPDC006197 TaxID=3156685 RepID=UPI0033ABF1E3
MELGAIQRRNRDATKKIRAAGRPEGKPSYGFQYVRAVPNGRVDRVELYPHAAEVLRTVARRNPRRPRDRVGEQRDRSSEPTGRAVAGRGDFERVLRQALADHQPDGQFTETVRTKPLSPPARLDRCAFSRRGGSGGGTRWG